MNIASRLLIIFLAGIAIWQFSDGFSLNMEILTTLDARWFNILFALSEGVLGPALAITAIVLASIDKHLLAAAIVTGLAIVFYCIPFVTFFIGIMIHGF
jgi:hypothetical protein